jgi:starch phosphorylase
VVGGLAPILLNPTFKERRSKHMRRTTPSITLDADQRLRELYADADAWVRKTILNVAASGRFSSDRAIAEYATEIWEVKPCPVP